MAGVGILRPLIRDITGVMMLRVKCLGFLVACMVLQPVYANDVESNIQRLLSIKSDPVQLEQAIQKGQERAMLCGYCHGKDGNSVKDNIPNLAEQNEEYLLKQFHVFANGERKSYVMEQLSKALSEEERINLSLYYSSLKVKSDAHLEGSEQGREKYQSFCFACHGEDGLGNKDMPRLAGQKKVFLEETLKGFKQGKTARAHSPMVKIMKAVKASDIEPLADYISKLP